MVFAAVGVPEAHAAPTLTTQVLNAASEAVGGLMCLDGVALGNLLELGPHGSGGAPCSSMRGIGIALLALVALVVIALGRMRLHTEQKRLDVARQLVEQGIEPPAGLLMGPARADLRKGIVLLFAGGGILAAGLMLGDRGMAAGALVPEFIGIGYLLSFWLASRPRGDAS